MRETDKMVLFWGGVYSQWYLAPFFDEDGNHFNCNEQYMMVKKAMFFNDHEAAKRIYAEPDPKEQKALGRLVGTFPGAQAFDATAWAGRARPVVRRANLFKFTQNPQSKATLLASGDKIIVEASPHDKIWGIGLGVDDPRAEDQAQWQGTNWLGEAIMDVRKLLRSVA